MRVVATQQGYYGHLLRNRGDVFVIRNDGDYTARWMRPAKGETAKPVAPKKPKNVKQIDDEENARLSKGKNNPNGAGPKKKAPEREELDDEGPEQEDPCAADEEEDEEAVEENKPDKSKGTGNKAVL